VTFLQDRGEPRGPHKKGESWEGRGDCIDCNACVVVCPMGIDIRDGSQLECINCGLCVDACDEIMDKVGRPRGLIAYDTDAAVAARGCGQPAVYKPIRPRTIYYASALFAVSVVMAWGLTHRRALDLHVLRDRNPMAVRLHDGAVRDGYTLKIANHAFRDKTVEVSVAGLAGARLKTPGAPATSGPLRLVVEANESRAARVFVIAPPGAATPTDTPVVFTVRDAMDQAQVKSVFTFGTTP
jgi:cytochrome c oxidase accessory protein FixG